MVSPKVLLGLFAIALETCMLVGKAWRGQLAGGFGTTIVSGGPRRSAGNSKPGLGRWLLRIDWVGSCWPVRWTGGPIGQKRFSHPGWSGNDQPLGGHVCGHASVRLSDGLVHWEVPYQGATWGGRTGTYMHTSPAPAGQVHHMCRHVNVSCWLGKYMQSLPAPEGQRSIHAHFAGSGWHGP